MAEGERGIALPAEVEGRIVLPQGADLTDVSNPRLQDFLRRRTENLGSFGHWIWSAEGEVCIYCSEELARIHEVSVEEFYRRLGTDEQILEIIHPDDRQRYRETWERALAALSGYEIDFRIVTASGKLRYVYEAAELVLDDEGDYLGSIGIVQDVTDYKRIEEELRQAKDGLNALFQSLGLPVFSLDSEGRTTFWNPAAERLFGWQQAEVLGRPLPMLPDEGAPTLLRRLQVQGLAQDAKPLEVAWPTRGGQLLPLSLTCTPLPAGAGSRGGLVVIALDLSEQKAAEREARETQERFRFLVETLPVPLAVSRASDGLALLVNRQAREILGHVAGVSNMRDPRNYIDPEQIRGFVRQLSERGRVTAYELCYRRPDGSPYLAHVTAERTTYAGQPAIIGVAVDISEQRRAADELRHSQKLEAVGLLTGGVAHDFNNLLTVMLGNAETLAADEDLPDSSRSQAMAIVETAERGANLTRQLLAFARRQALRPIRVDVNALIADLCRLLRRTLPAHIELQTSLDSLLPQGYVDRSQLETALVNLVLNARDALPEGGHVIVTTRAVPRGQEVVTVERQREQADGVAPEPQILITVTDDGLGMAPDVQARAFEPFFTTKGIGEGSGLGLSMVYGFAVQSGGGIRLQSGVGRGTSVELYIAAAPEHSPAAAPSARSASIATGTERILVVEDEPLVREYVAAQLEQLGYRVTSAPDGVKALQLLEQDRGFDLLLTDLIMPGGISGRQLSQKALVRRPDLRVLIMSGFTGDHPGSPTLEDLDLPLLRKPFNRRDLAQAVRSVLEAPNPRQMER